MKITATAICASLATALSICAYGGLFDNVIKAAGNAINVVNAVGTGTQSNQGTVTVRAADSAAEEQSRREACAKEQEKEEAERQDQIKKTDEAERARREAYQKEQEKKEAERQAQIKKANEEERARRRELARNEEERVAKVRKEAEERQALREEKERKKEAERSARRQKEEEDRKAKQAQEREEAERRNAEARQKKDETRTNARERLWRDAAEVIQENKCNSYHASPDNFKDDVQYPAVDGVTFSHAPLYKSITSGSSLTWALVKLGDGQKSINLEMEPHKAIGIECKTFTAGIKDDLKFLCAIPGSEKIEDVMKKYGESKDGFYYGGFTKPEQVPDIIVIGFQKKFPSSVSAEDAMGSIRKKYQGLQISKATEIDGMVNATTMGLVQKETRNLINFSNADVSGCVSQTNSEFMELPDESDAVHFFVYSTAVNGGMGGLLKREFEKSFKAGQAKYQALYDEGKLTEEIEKFGWRLGSEDGVMMNPALFYITSMAAKHALNENSSLGRREIEEARDLIKSLKARIKQMIASGELKTTSNISLRVYDKKAIVDLPKLEKKAAEKKAEEAKDAENKAKQEALDF